MLIVEQVNSTMCTAFKQACYDNSMENKPEGQAKEGKKKPRHRAVLLTLGGIVLVVVAFFAVKAYLDAPRDLGSDLVYVGKETYGNILGFDQLPGANYFFATSMT